MSKKSDEQKYIYQNINVLFFFVHYLFARLLLGIGAHQVIFGVSYACAYELHKLQFFF